MQEFYIKSAHAYMRYLDLPGEKTPILFIHGLGCAGSFDYPCVAAREGLQVHRCILVDLLGAGYSDKPETFDYRIASHVEYLKDFLNSLHLETVILFGHSLGGPIAIELAQALLLQSQQPQTGNCQTGVEALVLSEPNLEASTEKDGSYHIGKLSEEYFSKQGFQDLLKGCKINGNTMWAATLSHSAPYAVYRLSENAVQGRSPSWGSLLCQLPMKKCVIYGEKSLPDDKYDRLKEQGVPVRVVKNAGHSMAWENPQGLAEAILRILG